MKPIFADAIDFPIVLVFGLAVLIPLMLFQVVGEAFILSRVWRGNFRELTGLTFRANSWSLLAGIPTKILNAVIYGMLLPGNIPGFFAAYPWVVTIGTLIYFAVTVLVEARCARRWLRIELPRGLFWRGILLANVATYAVLAPLHYFGTRPLTDVRSFSRDASWSSHADQLVAYVADGTGHLQMSRIGGGRVETIVPAVVKDYLLSRDTMVCLYRDESGQLMLHQRATGSSNLIWQTQERFSINQVAFSPSGTRVAFASKKDSSVAVVDVVTGKRSHLNLALDAEDCTLAWSTEEDKFFLSHQQHGQFAVAIAPELVLHLESVSDTNELRLLDCYGRVGPSRWYGGGEWGQSYRSDKCGDLRAWSIPGLGSSVRIYRDESRERVFVVSVNPGLLHLSAFYFKDVAFLEGCEELLLEANEGIYLLNMPNRKLGTVAKGERFILLSPRYQKRL